MARTGTGYTRTLRNGNRVTVRVGRGRRSRFWKTVTVRRPDGTSDTRYYRRGWLGSWFPGSYSSSIPRWARR